MEVASQPGFGTPAYVALDAAARHLGVPVPPAVLEALAPAGWRRRVARRLLDERRLLAAYYAERRWAWVLVKLLLAEDAGGMARLGAPAGGVLPAAERIDGKVTPAL